MRLRALAVSLLALAVLATPAAARERGDTRVFALVPSPGFPAHAYVHPDGRVYEGTYTNPAGDVLPSRVFEWTAEGTLLRSWTIAGQDLSAAHGVQVATSTADGDLLLLDKAPARALVLDRRTGFQRTYASFPQGTVPNYAAWGTDGSLYVTDYGSAVLWRVPPGGGTPQRWLEHPVLAGDDFGTTGITLLGDRRTLLVAVMSGAGGGSGGNPAAGRLVEVPIGGDGRPGAPRVRWESRPFDGPDGFAVTRSGGVVIALLLANQLAVLGPDYAERERIGALLTGANGSPVPFDAPSSVRFSSTRGLVANQSFLTGNADHHAVLDVELGEEGLPEFVPARAAVKPASKATRKKCRARGKLRKGERRCRTAKRLPAARRG